MRWVVGTFALWIGVVAVIGYVATADAVVPPAAELPGAAVPAADHQISASHP